MSVDFCFFSMYCAYKSPNGQELHFSCMNKDIIILTCSVLKGNPMSKNSQFEEPVLYTTGACIQPLKVVDDVGNEKWCWVVSEFDGDTFLDGETFNPVEKSLTKQELLLAQQ